MVVQSYRSFGQYDSGSFSRAADNSDIFPDSNDYVGSGLFRDNRTFPDGYAGFTGDFALGNHYCSAGPALFDPCACFLIARTFERYCITYCDDDINSTVRSDLDRLSNRHRDAYFAFSYSDSHGDSNCNAYKCADKYPDHHDHLYGDKNAYRNFDCDAFDDSNPYANAHIYPDCYIYQYSDNYTDTYCDSVCQ